MVGEITVEHEQAVAVKRKQELVARLGAQKGEAHAYGAGHAAARCRRNTVNVCDGRTLVCLGQAVYM